MGAISKLHNKTYYALSRNFPEFTLRENIRPEWLLSSNLTRLEIDIYIEETRTAVEIQGVQHYQFIPHFHKTFSGFREQQRRDREKADLCYGRGVRLVEIACKTDLDQFVDELISDRNNKLFGELKYFYQGGTDIDDFEPEQNKPYKKNRKSIIYGKRYRLWLKRKKLVSKGLLKKVTGSTAQPGSKKQRRYARYVLESKKVGRNYFMVWGGRDRHILTIENGKCVCDCEYHKNTKKVCSHIIKVHLEHEIDIKQYHNYRVTGYRYVET